MLNTTKLKEALLDMQEQRHVLDEAIAKIQNVLAMLDGGTTQGKPTPGEESEAGKNSYITDAVTVLEAVGHPLHISELGAKIGEIRGAKIARASLESSLGRHISKTKDARVIKVKPSTYGLPAWKSQPLAFPVIPGPDSVAS